MAECRICAVENCGKPVSTRGWCCGHYHRWQRYGDPAGGVLFADNSGICSIEGCDKQAKSLGMCANHYHHLRKNGDPLARAPKRESIPLSWLTAHVSHGDRENCLQWPFATADSGRPSIRIDGKTKIAHREMCRLAHGEPPAPDFHAAHSCGRGSYGCINPRHLRWATAAENEADKLEHGTSNRGQRHGMVKLTEDQARQIKALKGEVTQRGTAKMFNVSRSAVNDIWTGRSWAWLQ